MKRLLTAAAALILSLWVVVPLPAVAQSTIDEVMVICTDVINLQYDPERRIDVEWDKGTDVAPYTVRLTMHVEDRKGMIAELSSRIADINTNILSLEASTRGEDPHARIDMTVEIQDVKHLDRVIKSIRAVEGVIGVERAASR